MRGFPAETQVYAVGPYTTKDLSIMSLPDIVNHYTAKSLDGTVSKPLAYLYPDVPKDVAFERFSNMTGKVWPPPPPAGTTGTSIILPSSFFVINPGISSDRAGKSDRISGYLFQVFVPTTV